jgi:hypothetical protein
VHSNPQDQATPNCLAWNDRRPENDWDVGEQGGGFLILGARERPRMKSVDAKGWNLSLGLISVRLRCADRFFDRLRAV